MSARAGEMKIREVTEMSFSDLFLKSRGMASLDMCPDCRAMYSMSPADDTVMVCGECGYSVDIEDYASDILERLEEEEGFYDPPFDPDGEEG